MPRGSVRASRASRSAGCPFRCTATIAFVLAVMRSATLSGDRQYVPGSTSAKTGTARWCSTGVAEAMNVCAGTITSSPGPMSRAARAVWMAVVPELVATQWGTPFQAANASSKAATASPVSWVRPPERRASATALTSSSPRAGQGGNGFVRTFGPPSFASASAIGGRIIGQRRRACTFRLRRRSAILRGGFTELRRCLMDLGITDRVALVTGAGRGIGRQICLTLAAEGARVAGNDVFRDRADAVAEEIRSAGGQAVGVVADVTDGQAVATMVERITGEWGGVDILLNNTPIPLIASSQ